MPSFFCFLVNSEQMFKWNDFFCIRDDMQTLKINTNVATSVIDIWTFILNDGEKYRSDESPLRLFCTIGSVVTHPNYVSLNYMFLHNIYLVSYPKITSIYLLASKFSRSSQTCHHISNFCY